MRWTSCLLLTAVTAACRQPTGPMVGTSGAPTGAAHSTTVEVTRTPSPVAPGPRIVYARGDPQRTGELVVATSDGGQQVVSQLPVYNVVLNAGEVDPATGGIVFGSPAGGLLLSRRGGPPVTLVDPGKDPWHDEDVLEPRISPDGQAVAYAAFSTHAPHEVNLRLYGLSDGADRLLAQGSLSHADSSIVLVPLGWSPDGRLVYLVETCDCGYWGRALYAADTATGRVTPVEGAAGLTGYVTLAPDRTRVAYATWETVIDAGGNLERLWPNQLGVLDLRTAEGKVVAEPDRVDTWVRSPTWSPDGTRIAYALGTWNTSYSIRALDLATGKTSVLLEPDDARQPGMDPRVWLPGDLLVCLSTAENDYRTVLWLVDLRSGVQTEIDRASDIEVVGWFSEPAVSDEPVTGAGGGS